MRNDEFGHSEAQALAQAAKAVTGASSAGALADLLGKPERGASSTVQNWLDGRASPRFEPTMRLLRLVGALSEERWDQITRGELGETTAAVPHKVPAARPDSPEEVRAAAVRLLRQFQEALPSLLRTLEVPQSEDPASRPGTAVN